MPTPSPRFAAAICGIVALLALRNTLSFYRQTESGPARGDPYGILLQQTRLQALIASLPAVDVVGYVTEPDSFLSTDTNKYLGAEYAFAPRILVRQSQFPQRWIVGDFSETIDSAAFARTHGFEVVRKFGEGLFLFKRNGVR